MHFWELCWLLFELQVCGALMRSGLGARRWGSGAAAEPLMGR